MPWDNATSSCSEYANYVKSGFNSRINYISDGPKRIINGVLRLDPTKRWKLSDIISDPWYKQDNLLFDFKFMASDPEKLMRLIRENSSTQLSS